MKVVIQREYGPIGKDGSIGCTEHRREISEEEIRKLFGEAYDNRLRACRFDFGKAIELLKQGKRVYRSGWNGKGQYIELASGISYRSPEGEVVNAQHQAIGNKAIAFVGTSGVQMGWLASQADMLAEDWMVL